MSAHLAYLLAILVFLVSVTQAVIVTSADIQSQCGAIAASTPAIAGSQLSSLDSVSNGESEANPNVFTGSLSSVSLSPSTC